MVDPFFLANDVLQNVVFLATPPLLWLFLYLLAWGAPDLGRAVGFGRLTFWLLLPGALLGTIANLPFAAVGPSVLALNIGGGAIPVALAYLLLRRSSPNAPGGLLLFATLFILESGAALLWVLAAPTSAAFTVPFSGGGLPIGWDFLGVLAVAVAATGTLLTLVVRTRALRPVGLAFALASMALVATFATTATTPKVGIVSSFPWYLVAPALVGVAAVLLARRYAGRPTYEGLGIAYAASTLGVLVGADVLRQPPLYAHPSDVIYAIGGAGILDLLYLTGLLALGSAFLVYFAGRRAGWADPPPRLGESGVARRTLVGRMRHALLLLLAGQYRAATEEATRATQDARSTLRALYGLPPVSFSGHPWSEVGAPPWVDADQANLEELNRQPSIGARDAWRAHLTARHLVRLARLAGRRRYGSLVRRSSAFLADLGVLLVPAAAVWWFLFATRLAPGLTLAGALAGSTFNAAAYGFTAYALAYFVIAEGLFGTTVGKRLLRLRVSDRDLRRPRPLAVLVRDLPKILPLFVLGFGGAVIALLLVHGGGGPLAAGSFSVAASLPALGLLALAVGFGVGLCGLASFVVIYASPENQRLGDILAGTWVIQEP